MSITDASRLEGKGAIPTGAVAGAGRAIDETNAKVDEAMLRNAPLGRRGEPSDDGLAALFPCSPTTARIGGQVPAPGGGGVRELG
jgi:hypothetical protein